jgi:intracellular septation protein A
MGVHRMRRTLILFIIECLPLAVLFGAGQYTSFYNAIWWYLGSVIAAILLIGHLAKRFPYLSVVFGLVIIVSGTLSNLYQKPDIIIFADSLYYFCAAIALVVGWLRGVNLLQKLVGPTFSMEKRGWDILLWRWVAVLILAGVSNELVRILETPEFWIEFQFYRTIVILSFATSQLFLTRQYRILGETNPWGVRIKPTDTPV